MVYTNIHYSNNQNTDSDIARVCAILDRAQDILTLDDTDALFEEASLFLELEPTPIGPCMVPTFSIAAELSNEAFPSMFTSLFTTAAGSDASCLNTTTSNNTLLLDPPIALVSSMMMIPSTPPQDPFSLSEMCPPGTSATLHCPPSDTGTRPTKRQRLSTSDMMMRGPSTVSLETSSFLHLTGEEEEDGLSAEEDCTLESSSGVESNSVRPYQANQWMERFQGLIGFKKTHGHCLVPHKFPEDQQLAQWVKRQRYQFKLKLLGRRSTMTDDRQTELEDIGFVWDSHMAAWYERLESLKEFRSRYGHSNVPSNYETDRQLAVWVKCQRRQMKLFKKGFRSTLSHDRFMALEQLGFDWNPRNIS